MSASQDKKSRQDGGSAKGARLQARQKELQEKKKLRNKVIAVVAALAILVAFVLVFNSDLLYSGVTAITINGRDYTVTDFNYYYISAISSYQQEMENMYGSYYGMMMPTFTIPLRDQSYESDAGDTWADYFTDIAFDTMLEVSMLCDKAEEAGYELTDDDVERIEDLMATLEAQAEASGYANLGSYMVYNYGKGMTEEIYRENVTRRVLAESYSQSVYDANSYTEEELNTFYDENKDLYDFITYRRYFVEADIVEDDESTEEDETVDFETAMAEASAIAEDFVASVTDEASFAEKAREVAGDSSTTYEDDDATLYTESGENISDTYSDWLLDESRQEGDICCISTGSEESASSNGYYVLYFVGRDNNEYNSVSGYYALMVPETVNESDYESTEEYEAAVESANTSAEFILQQTLDAYTAGEQTYDGFVEACSTYASNFSAYGEIDELGVNDLTYEAMSDWFFDDSREEGDVEIIQDEESGDYLLLYYSGEGRIYADRIADYHMRQDDHEQWINENLEGYSESSNWLMHFARKIGAVGA